MTVLQAIILGLVQGLTEFLPISSSGHLVIVPQLFNWPEPSVAFDVLLHLATLLAVVVYFSSDLLVLVRAFVAPGSLPPADVRPARRLALWIVIGTIPAAVIGGLFQGFFESLFSSTLAVGVFLLVTAALLTMADVVAARTHATRGVDRLTAVDAVVVGLFQSLAIAPGISRSGSTMSAGVYLGFDRPAAARYSFLLSIPIILAAGLLKVPDLGGTGDGVSAALVAGAVAAFVSGLAAVFFLLRYLRTHTFRVFAVYTAVVGLVVVVLSLV